LNADPLGGNKHEPLSLNKYLYANADPVNKKDPTGRFAITQDLSVGNILATLPTGFFALRRSYAQREIRMDKVFYDLTSTVLNGMRIELAAVARDPTYAEFRWVQEVATNAPPLDPTDGKPVGPPNVYFLDRMRENRLKNIPYYYDETTEQTIGSTSPGGIAYLNNLFKGYTKFFADEPRFSCDAFSRNNTNQIYATFTTYLVGVRDKGSNSYIPLASADWGFKINLLNKATCETNVTLDPLVLYNPKQ
jgi:hypothetical protein